MKKAIIVALSMLILASCGSDQTSQNLIGDTGEYFYGIEAGTYHDDMDSELSITKDGENEYSIDFGVYKVSFFEGATGEYDTKTGILHFAGKDVYGKSVSADVRSEDGHLVVTILDWEYEDYLPNGTKLIFYKQK